MSTGGVRDKNRPGAAYLRPISQSFPAPVSLVLDRPNRRRGGLRHLFLLAGRAGSRAVAGTVHVSRSTTFSRDPATTCPGVSTPSGWVATYHSFQRSLPAVTNKLIRQKSTTGIRLGSLSVATNQDHAGAAFSAYRSRNLDIGRSPFPTLTLRFLIPRGASSCCDQGHLKQIGPNQPVCCLLGRAVASLIQGSGPPRFSKWDYSRICDQRNGAPRPRCTAAILRCRCPLWVKSRHAALKL
jgi:hypothetical protein